MLLDWQPDNNECLVPIFMPYKRHSVDVADQTVDTAKALYSKHNRTPIKLLDHMSQQGFVNLRPNLWLILFDRYIDKFLEMQISSL